MHKPNCWILLHGWYFSCWLPAGIIWQMVDRQEGMRNLDLLNELESDLIIASELGYQVILDGRGTLPWSQSITGFYCSSVSAHKLSAILAFMEDLFKRYSSPPFIVKYWELGNEPDVAPELVSPDMVFGC
jgi:hypothetical protein